MSNFFRFFNKKVLLVGGKDFTIAGKPLVSKEIVRIEATVIEKTLSNNVIVFSYTPRKDNRKMSCNLTFRIQNKSNMNVLIFSLKKKKFSKEFKLCSE
jgi:hypothetical protein